MNRSSEGFFTYCLLWSDPNWKGLLVDTNVLDSLRAEDMDQLSMAQRRFVLWYRAQRAKGLKQIHIGGDPVLELTGDPLLDVPQEEVCAEFMRMVNAPDVPDSSID